MSILTRLIGQHLDDAAFAEIWTNAVADGATATHPHFAACAECRVRFASYVAWLDDVRADGVAEADAVFSHDRLASQQAHIMRRLEGAGQPTRVIAFPKSPAVPAPRSPVRWWVAGAAAAGLITGVGLGQLMHFDLLTPGRSTFPADRIVEVGRATASANTTPSSIALISDVDLHDLEDAATPKYEALRAYDTLTPRAADMIPTPR